MKNINAYGIINNRYDDMSFEEKMKFFFAFKEYVSKSARGKRKARILRSSIADIPKNKWFGYLGRLEFDSSSNKVYYCCGQDWHSEMAMLRNIFDR